MGAKRTRESAGGQGDLFGITLFPVRQPTETVRSADLSLRIKTAMGRALRECPYPNATVVAALMSDLTGETITADILYSYTAPGKPEHQISLIRFVAFVRATGARWLYDVVVENEGLTVMEGREAHFAQLGHMQQEHARLGEVIATLKRELKARPVQVEPRRRPGGRP